MKSKGQPRKRMAHVYDLCKGKVLKFVFISEFFIDVWKRFTDEQIHHCQCFLGRIWMSINIIIAYFNLYFKIYFR